MDRERKKADRIEQELVYLEKAGMKNGSHFFLFSQPFHRSALRRGGLKKSKLPVAYMTQKDLQTS